MDEIGGVKLYELLRDYGDDVRTGYAERPYQAAVEPDEGAVRRRLSRCGVGRRYLDAPARPDMLDGFDEGNGVYVQGTVGNGKTWLAAGIARAWAETHTKALRFVGCTAMLCEIRSTFSSRDSEAEVTGRYERSPLLVIDDMGKEAPSPWTLSKLFEIVDYRYSEMLPTVVTSQYTMAALVGRLDEGQSETAVAIVSRMSSTMRVVTLEGGDRRVGGVARQEEKQEEKQKGQG